MSGVLFEDIFEVGKLNPDGKKFDRGERKTHSRHRVAQSTAQQSCDTQHTAYASTTAPTSDSIPSTSTALEDHRFQVLRVTCIYGHLLLLVPTRFTVCLSVISSCLQTKLKGSQHQSNTC